MISFLDGPAAGVALDVRAAPLYLRVVTTGNGKWDALDQPGDEPLRGETIHVYRRDGPATVGNIDGKGIHRPFAQAQYRFVCTPPDDAVRSTAAWGKWTP